ncbi:MAG TPA: TIGR01777 family oxidoreductase [Thermoanaerobaculia bacterium]|jgi:hypothetical protein|nr:TIGR01777 family oxidoreductase [Thermoanaerobaculia bacterium]
MKVVVAGGTGFIGTRLVTRLVGKGHDVVVLTRDASRSYVEIHPRARILSWAEGATAWRTELDGAGAVVNLAGATIATRWTSKAKERIVKSRIRATEALFEAAEAAKARPAVLVNASGVGYYGPHGDEELTEESPAGADFLARTCVAWEDAAKKHETLGMRVVRLRTGLVLGFDGGALPRIALPFRFALGGKLGSGTQWMSWIHLDDLVDLYLLAIENGEAKGALNAAAPRPVQNIEFTKTLAKILHRPSFASAPAGALKLLLGEMSTLLLDGQRAVPKRALELGFRFRFETLERALRDLLG